MKPVIVWSHQENQAKPFAPDGQADSKSKVIPFPGEGKREQQAGEAVFQEWTVAGAHGEGHESVRISIVSSGFGQIVPVTGPKRQDTLRMAV